MAPFWLTYERADGGFRFHGTAQQALGAIALAIATGFAFAWVAALLAVVFETPEAVQGARASLQR